jgi:hypothetical protein
LQEYETAGTPWVPPNGSAIGPKAAIAIGDQRDEESGTVVRPQVSGFEESVQRGKRLVWILFRKKMTALNRFEFHVYGFVLPSRRNVEERGRRWGFASPQY